MFRMKKREGYVVAVVGATGAVGRKLLAVLEERRFPVGDLRPLASDRPGRRTVPFDGREIEVAPLGDGSFAGADIAFFAAGGEVSRRFAPVAAGAGALAIDKSSVFRMAGDVPLVVPEVNGEDIGGANGGIVASPNCSTSQLVMAIAPLERAARVRRLVVDTYQSVSGAGMKGIADLTDGARAWMEGRAPPPPRAIARPIAFNAVPHIDVFGEGGFTGEELKLMNETRKILHRPDMLVTCTAVRVPVFVGHSEAVTVELDRAMDPAEARSLLAAFPGVAVIDDPGSGAYPTPLEAADRDEVFVGRIRRDPSCPTGLHLWVVSDNLRKGAATNAVQIAEHAIRLAE